jgi:uncharacterized membrane protein
MHRSRKALDKNCQHGLAEIWVEAIASVLGFYLYIVHILTAKAHFLNKALFKDRNFVLSTIMFFAFGFILLPTLALTSPVMTREALEAAKTAEAVALEILNAKVRWLASIRATMVMGLKLKAYTPPRKASSPTAS